MGVFFLFAFTIQAQTVVMETGKVSVDHNVKHVTLNNTFQDPIVIAASISYNGGDAAAVHIYNVTTTGFDIHLDEALGLDNWHVIETVHYLVVEKGVHTFASGVVMEAGVISSSNMGFKNVQLQHNFTSTPAVFTQLQSNNSSTRFVKTRHYLVGNSNNQLKVKLEKSQSVNSGSLSSSEDIAYLAMDYGVSNVNGVLFEVGNVTTNHTFKQQNFTQTLSNSVHFVASISTFNGPDPAEVRWRNLTSNSVQVFLQEDKSSTSSTTHTNEKIDYMVIDDNGSAAILPIELLSFNHEVINQQQVQLNWLTASEVNNSHFTIEKSKDARVWREVDRVEGAGNSNSPLSYSTVDENPWNGISYYRLKQTDYNGDFTYSEVIPVELNIQEVATIQLYPNPAISTLYIESDESTLNNTMILNAAGQDVSNKINIQGNFNGVQVMDVSNLSPGIYYIKSNTTSKAFYKN